MHRLFIVAEIVRLALVLSAATFVARPLFSRRWFGGEDLLWYLQQLQDYLVQIHHGTFPPMVGQTEFYWIGVPHVRTLLYLYVGSIIDWATGGTLAPLDVLYFTMASSIILGGVAMYFVLVALNPARRWTATAFAVLFVACPATLVQTMVMQMVPTIVALPLVPIVFYAAVRFMRSQDVVAGLLLAVGLSLMMITHIWMTLWVVMFVCISLTYCLVTTRRRVRALLILLGSATLFVAMSLYYVVAILQTDYLDATAPSNPANRHLFLAQSYFESIAAFERSILSHHFLPITDVSGNSSQLGLSLWIALAIAILALIRGRRSAETAILVATCIIVGLYLFPFTIVSNVLYRVLPSIFEIGNNWPDQRLYIPLATTVSIAGFLGIGDLALVPAALKRGLVAVLLVVACGWSLSQANTIDEFVVTHMTVGDAVTADIQLPENASLNGSSVSSSGADYEPPSGYSGSAKDLLDPRLDDGLADNREVPVTSNLQWLVDGPGAELSSDAQFAGDDHTLDSQRVWRRAGQLPGGVETLGHIQVEPAHRYLLSFPVQLTQARAEILLAGKTIQGVSRLGPGVTHWNSALWVSTDQADDVTVTGSVYCAQAGADCSAEIGPFTLQEYSGVTLPIDVVSLFPFRANVAQTSASYLETHRVFVPGYVARVNGETVSPMRSPRGRLMVALPQGADAQVEIDYISTPLIVISRGLSGITALLVLVLLLGQALPRRWTWMRFFR